jgi:hypothetical protein
MFLNLKHLFIQFTLPTYLTCFLCACFLESVSSSQASSSPVVRYVSRCYLALRSLFRCHVSCPAWACPRNLNWGATGDARKEEQAEDQTCTKLGSDRLGARLETHRPSSSEFIIYSGNTRWKGISQGRGHSIVVLWNRRNLWQLLSEHKHLSKNRCTASCPLLQLRLCLFKCAIYWA